MVSSSPKAARPPTPVEPLSSVRGSVAAPPIVPIVLGNSRRAPGVERLLVCSAYWRSHSARPVAGWDLDSGPCAIRLADLEIFGKAWNVSVAPYGGPSVFGYETDMPLRRAAQISVHTSPLAALGGTDAGGMNVYIRELACHLAQQGLPVDIFTRRTDPDTPEVREFFPGVNVIAITAGPPEPIGKNDLFPLLPEFAEQMALYSVREGVRYDVVHAHYWLSGWVAELARRYWETPFVQMFHTTAHMKNAVAAHADRETDLRLRPKSACSRWPTASSPPTRTSARISSGAWACRPKKSARFPPASTSSCSSLDRGPHLAPRSGSRRMSAWSCSSVASTRSKGSTR